MSWIDKKYKNHFKEQKYPEGMKQKGWDSMQSLLDKQMPITTPKSMISNPWYLSGVAAVVVTVVGIPFFITNQPKEVSPAQQLPAPTSIQMNPADGVSISPDAKELQPSDFSIESLNSTETNSAIESEETSAQQTNTDVAENVAHESISEPIVSKTKATEEVVANTTQEEPQIRETKGGVIVATEVAEESAVEEMAILDEGEVKELLEEEIFVPIAETPVMAGSEVLAEEKLPAEEEGVVSSLEAVLAEVSTNQIEEEEEEIEEAPVSESIAPEVFAESYEQNTVAEDKILAVAKTDDIEELEEGNSVKILDKSLEASVSRGNDKAAHLAFLEAEESLPIPDLLTFSKERFALSIWGGYLFTGKVLSGGDKGEIEKRNASEKPIYTTPTGVGLDYFVNKNWTLGVGLGWAEYGEDVDYTLYHVTSSIDTVALDGRYDSPSNYPNIISIDSTRIIDTVNQGHWNYNLSYRNDDSTTNTYSGRNTFRYIEVPLTVGYRFGTGRIKPWVKAGVIVGLPIEARYRYPNFETSSYTEGGSKASLSAIQYSGLLQVGADFYISRAISVRINALGSYQLNSMLRNDGIGQRYYRVGASIGVAYNF